MAKSAKKPAPPQPQRRVSAAKPLPAGNRPRATKPTIVATELPGPGAKERDSGGTAKTNNWASGTKQSRVLAMLHSSTGATIEAMMQATGWQQHSVRGFLAGVVRKRLKLKLISKKVDGSRVYQIAGDGGAKATPRGGQASRRLAAMPRVRIAPALPDWKNIDAEIARLRDLGVKALRAQWHNALGRPAPSHLPRHLLFRILAYRLQADRFGDLDAESRRLLDGADSPEKAGENARTLADRQAELKPGTVLVREWNGRMHRVSVLADGFTYDGKTYSSLSKAALAITGTRWNGPRFFGLRGASLKEAPA